MEDRSNGFRKPRSIIIPRVVLLPWPTSRKVWLPLGHGDGASQAVQPPVRAAAGSSLHGRGPSDHAAQVRLVFGVIFTCHPVLHALISTCSLQGPRMNNTSLELPAGMPSSQTQCGSRAASFPNVRLGVLELSWSIHAAGKLGCEVLTAFHHQATLPLFTPTDYQNTFHYQVRSMQVAPVMRLAGMVVLPVYYLGCAHTRPCVLSLRQFQLSPSPLPHPFPDRRLAECRLGQDL